MKHNKSKMWLKCPKCDEIVDFEKQIGYLFDNEGEAEFDAEEGVFFHTIICDKCSSCWTMVISKISKLVCVKDLKDKK